MEPRVSALENDMKEIRSDIKTLLIDIAEIKGMMRAAPTAKDFGELKGRVESLPTSARVASIVAIATALITLLLKWKEIAAVFGYGA